MMTLLGFAALLLQFIGTLFVWFDTERISYAIQPCRAVLTDDPKWKSWRYNKSKLGFALLFIGILLQCLYLFAASEGQIELRPDLVIAIATAALAIATFVLAFVTRSTATTATKALALEQMPILGVRDLRTRTTSPQMQFATLASIKVGIELFNAGRIPVKFKVKRIAVTVANQQLSTGEFAPSSGRVLPGASTIFWQPTTLTLNPPISTFPANGDVRFDYEYSDELGGQLQSVSEAMDYTVSPSQPPGSFFVDRLQRAD
jgi:hypothetical protein